MIARGSITAYPRIHVTLVGMDSRGYRVNGGIGFALREPSCLIEFETGGTTGIIDDRRWPLAESSLGRLRAVMDATKEELKLPHSVWCRISGAMRTHHGFGSTTAIRLACLEALTIANAEPSVPRDLVRLSRRGGTSGIGINTFFSGGFVFDIGHSVRRRRELRPSCVAEGSRGTPLVVTRCTMPDWAVGICIPNDVKSLSEDQERLFFRAACPIDHTAAAEILYNSVYGVLGGVLEDDLGTFCRAINSIQTTQWKERELQNYDAAIVQYMNVLKDCGAEAAGMSSIGPAIFFLGSNVREVVSKASSVLPAATMIETRVQNDGRRVECNLAH